MSGQIWPTGLEFDTCGIDTVIPSVISELECISSLKEEQRAALKAFVDGKAFALPEVFSKVLTLFRTVL